MLLGASMTGSGPIPRSLEMYTRRSPRPDLGQAALAGPGWHKPLPATRSIGPDFRACQCEAGGMIAARFSDLQIGRPRGRGVTPRLW